ncbi:MULTISPECIES: CinA family protein [unclassified Leifsonia]|uniref:CinA family protein n=1 Tax=unclassified Leifsonia TaxID=2663824 RepID=UPI0009E8C89A|nr:MULTISPECIES: CinA family protein [unclassified Leifsonia]
MNSTRCTDVAALIAERATRLGIRIGCAESLTSGSIAQYLGAAPGAADWFAGGIIAYADDVKFRVLKVQPGPVVTARTAAEMAAGAAALLRVHHAIAVTGVGGPGPAEGKPAGTVYVGLATCARSSAIEIQVGGDPEDVVATTTFIALRLLLARLGGAEAAADLHHDETASRPQDEAPVPAPMLSRGQPVG